MAPTPRPVLDRIVDKFLVGDGCWEWTGAKSAGYGVFWDVRRHRNRRATYIMWELMVGPVPDGAWLLHHCDNPGCVRPDHLFLGAQKDNMRDCTEKGRNGGARSQAAKTHCPKGHAYDQENTYLIRTGGRACRQCKREAERSPEARPMMIRTHCPQGHLYDEENTYYNSNGWRGCRTCRREANRRWKERNQ